MLDKIYGSCLLVGYRVRSHSIRAPLEKLLSSLSRNLNDRSRLCKSQAKWDLLVQCVLSIYTKLIFVIFVILEQCDFKLHYFVIYKIKKMQSILT